MSNELSVKIDLSNVCSLAQRVLKTSAEEAARMQARDYFSQVPGIGGKPIKGPGLLEIEEYLSKVFASEEFQKRMDEYIEVHFEKAFQAAMEKALDHHCRKKAFAIQQIASDQ